MKTNSSPAKTILLSGSVAGTLDIMCAIFILAGGNAAGVFRFIARGALGDTAFEGGPEMILYGALFHYLIAFSFAIGYYLVFPLIPALRKYPIPSGLLYGVFVWAFMHYLVLPFTYNTPEPATFQNSWKGVLILMVAVGLPISLITAKHYSRNTRT